MGDEATINTAPAGTNTLDMVLAAITSINDRKGATVPAIKTFILANYTTVDPTRLRSRLKKALEKGFDMGIIARPKTSDVSGEFEIRDLSF